MDFEDEDEIKQLNCHNLHIFHPECIEAWIRKNQKEAECPFCRKNVEEGKIKKRRFRLEETEMAK